MNIIVGLEFELAYYVTIQHINHYAIETPSNLYISKSRVGNNSKQDQ